MAYFSYEIKSLKRSFQAPAFSQCQYNRQKYKQENYTAEYHILSPLK